MANFAYKKTVTTAMKVAGILDSDNLTVDVDGEEKKLSTLLSGFNGAHIEINIKVKDEEELDEPIEAAEE
nr:MAG TPA: YonK protein [Caudoviricetes sp.]